MKIRKIFKRSAAVFCVLTMLLALCSCINMEVGIILNENGSARAYTEIAVQKSALEMAGKSEEDFFAQVTKQNEGSEWDSQEIFTKVIDGKEYVGERYYKDGAINSLGETMFSGDMDSSISFQREGGDLLANIVLSGVSQASTDSASSEMQSYLSQGMMNIKFRLTAPYPIKETNGVQDADGTVYWDLMPLMTGESESLEMTARYEAGPDLTMILLIVGGAVLVIAAIAAVVLIVRRKSQKAAISPASDAYLIPEAPEQPMPEAEPAAEKAENTAAVSEPAEGAASEKKFCKSCGAQLKEGDRFCSSCGETIE